MASKQSSLVIEHLSNSERGFRANTLRVLTTLVYTTQQVTKQRKCLLFQNVRVWNLKNGNKQNYKSGDAKQKQII